MDIQSLHTDDAIWRDFNRTSLFSILVVHRFHAPIRQSLRQKQAGRKQQTELDEICPVCVRTLPECSALQNQVGWGHCLARYNYTIKLSLSLGHNGR